MTPTETAMAVAIPHPHEVEADTQPTSVLALLRELGVKQVSAERQKPALRAWLATHQANATLRVSMRRNGYGYLLKESSAAHD
jgi:hypothetical protein